MTGIVGPAPVCHSSGPAHKKVTLIKDRVGQTRVPSFPLPPFTHVYGAQNVKDPENAGQVLSSWTLPVRSADAVAARSWIRSNAQALKNGHITAKSQREYSLTHPNILVPKPQSAIREKFHAPTDVTYGRPSAKTDDRLKDIIEGKYNPSMREQDKEYPDLAGMVRKGRLPAPRPTKSSQLLCQAKEGKPTEASAKLFMMRKFLRVKPRTNTNRAST